MKNMNIDEIEALTFDEAKVNALEIIQIKEHDCIFVDFEGYFGYSCLVFKNGKHIYYADDYELHHEYMMKEENGREKLRQWYIDAMNRILYTDKELLEEPKTYDEYQAKDYFLRNYWIMRYDYVSAFYIGDKQLKELERKRRKKNYPYYNPVSFCYVADENIVKQSIMYRDFLEKSFEKLQQSDEAFREMVSYELANHEACITNDVTDGLSALGMRYEDLTEERQKIVREELKKQIDYYNAD